MASKIKDRVLTISINSEFVKICDVTRNGKSITVHKMATVPTPENSFSDGAIKERDALAKAIKTALDNNRITTDNVIFTVASSRIASKEVVIPKVKPNKISDIVNTNAAEYFPVNIDEHIIQHIVLEEIKEQEEEKLKLLVMAAPSKIVASYYGLASSIGLKIEAIDYIGNSVSQVIKHEIGNSSSIIIYVENDSTIVNIFQNNVLKMQRTIPYGESVIVEACMEEYDLDYDDAVKKLEDEPVIGEHITDNAITEQLRYLISNIKRIIDFYVSRNLVGNLESAYVLGTIAFMKGFDNLLTNELNISFTGVTQLKDVITDKKTFVDDSLITSYIPNMGAAYASINFKPKGVDETKSSRSTSKTFKVAFIAAVGIAIILTVVPAVRMFVAKSKLKVVNEQIDKIKSIDQIVDDFYTAKDIYTDADNFSKMTSNNDDKLAEFLNELETVVPSDVAFTSIAVDNGTFTVSGTAKSKLSVAALIQQFRGLKNVSQTNLASESESLDNSGALTVTFSMTFNITADE